MESSTNTENTNNKAATVTLEGGDDVNNYIITNEVSANSNADTFALKGRDDVKNDSSTNAGSVNNKAGAVSTSKVKADINIVKASGGETSHLLLTEQKKTMEKKNYQAPPV